MLDSSHASPPHAGAADFEAARRLHRTHGTSYYFATAFFPKPLREATFALYAFFRVPDEIVDNPDCPDPRRALEDWRDGWRRAYRTGEADTPVLRAAAHIFHRHAIPYEFSEAFLDAMFRDLDDDRYATYADLEGYMYGSAAAVGLMMSHAIGFSDPAALPLAEKLGYAMQLTNFLRDIDEDFQQRGRIYLPLDEMKRWGVGESDIAARKFGPGLEALMRFEAARAHRLYEEAAPGVALLNPEGRRAVRVASALYRAILTRLEKQGFDPFAGRARTDLWEKAVLTARVWR